MSRHHLEKFLNSAFIALFSLSAVLLLTGIDSFTGLFVNSKTSIIASSCSQTNPPSLPCSDSVFGECEPLYRRDFILTQAGETRCCCLPPPEIEIVR